MDAAKIEAHRSAASLQNGEISLLQLSNRDHSAYTHAVSEIRPPGRSLEAAASEFAEAIHMLGKRTSLTGPRQKFCAGIVSGLTATDACAAAYPCSSRETARKHASRLGAKEVIQAEIARMRGEAQKVAGGVVLTLAEKRSFLARLVRVQVALLPHDSDLFVSIERGKDGVKFRLGDKLAAIKLDNDLAGEGAESGVEKELIEFLCRMRK